MSVISYLSDLLEEVFVPTVAYADDEPVEESTEETEEAPEDQSEAAAEPEEADDEEEEEEEDDDDEDEDEPEDIYPALREAAEGPCHKFKHHFDECVERVTAAQEEDGYEDRDYKEDCVEEFFHLNHCIDDIAAPALFRKLK